MKWLKIRRNEIPILFSWAIFYIAPKHGIQSPAQNNPLLPRLTKFIYICFEQKILIYSNYLFEIYLIHTQKYLIEKIEIVVGERCIDRHQHSDRL